MTGTVTGQQSDKFHALHVAVAGGHVAIALLLLEQGASVSALDYAEGTPLDWAAYTGNVILVRLLLKHGARCSWGLHSAVASHNVQVVEILLNNGADIHWRFKTSENTLLHRAIGLKYRDEMPTQQMINALWLMKVARTKKVVNESDSDSEVDECDDPNRRMELIRLLLEKGAAVNESGKYGQTPIHLAAARGNEAVVKLLLEGGAMPNAQDFNLRVALHEAMERKNRKKDNERDKIDYAIARLLIEKGASVDLVDRGRFTALHYAARRGHEAAVKLLLDCGANVKLCCDTFAKTALDFAASCGSQLVLQLLLDNGAAGKDDALFYAAFYGSHRHEGAVRLLLESGADPNVKGKGNGDLGQYSQLTVLDMAVKNEIEWLVQLLLEKGADPHRGRPMYYAAQGGNVTILHLLLESGADVNAVESTQERVSHPVFWNRPKPTATLSTGLEYTTLETAADNGHESVVQILLEKGADVRKGNPLYYAVESGKEKIVRLLLEHGAEINAVAMSDRNFVHHVPDNPIDQMLTKVRGNFTVLETAAAKGLESVVQLLLQKGADIHQGRPYHYAVKSGNNRVVQLLQNNLALT